MPDKDLPPVRMTPEESKRYRQLIWLVIVLSILSAVFGLNRFYKQHNPDPLYVQAQRQSHDPMAVKRRLIVNKVYLDIPIPYFKTGAPPEGVARDVSLIVMYPDFLPLKETPQRLWEKGEWYNNVMILLGDPTGRKKPADIFSSLSKSYDATELRNNEYGLDFYTQPNGIKNDGGDMWVEGQKENPQSVIHCMKQVTEDYNPQCTLYVLKENIWYNINFDKDLLPHWNDIKAKSLALIDSFRWKPISPLQQ